MTSLLKRLTRRYPKAEHLTLTVYSRRDCSCCDQALRLLERFRRRYRFRVEVIDIDRDPALVARHGEWVPVVSIGGKVRFRGKVNPVLLERLLTAESRPG
jgi:glutaredoxin